MINLVFICFIPYNMSKYILECYIDEYTNIGRYFINGKKCSKIKFNNMLSKYHYIETSNRLIQSSTIFIKYEQIQPPSIPVTISN